MAIRLGLDAKLYINTGESYVSPTWAEIKNVVDLSLPLEKDSANVSTRGTGSWKAEIGTMKSGGFDFNIVWDTEDPHFADLFDSFLNGTPLELAVMDGPITTHGSQGLRGEFEVMKFNRNEKLAEAITADISIKLTYFPLDPPNWLVVA
jgi:hypothetical protein